MSKDIRSYREKRDFAKTPEPPPRRRRGKRAETVFVVHRHEARRLHFDLRLEVDGVLKSFAVPKGFSFDPKDKHLAVHTEDHPLEYEHFDGVIPAGQYGAGVMTIWDRGAYELLNAPWDQALGEGKIELRLRGAKLRGEWHLVRLKKERDQWLMFKARDRYARDKGEPPVGLDLLAVPPRPLPRRLTGMQPTGPVPRFLDSQWAYEPWLCGLRVFIEKAGESVRFRGTTRRLTPAAAITEALNSLRAENAILDGMLVALDESQRPSQATLEAALAGNGAAAIHYYAFDLLYYDQWDVRSFPLSERKAALASILPTSRVVVFVDHERNRAAELLETASAIGLPGVIAKRADSPYERGPSENWVKIVADDRPTPRDDHQRAGRKQAGRVTFTNRRKVFWPRMGYTKGDLIDYYNHVADWILPYLHDRPLSLNRFPDGIAGQSFFQKDTPDHTPSWVKTLQVPSDNRDEASLRYVLCNDRDTLLYLANLAAIELHPWSSHKGSLETPDWAIFDLDPTTDDLQLVVQVARHLERLLRDLGLRPYLKTSGSRGLHIYVPLIPKYTYDQVRMFCEGVARVIALRHPRLATIERSKPRRDGKVYVDFLQNRRGQTVVGPYVVRPVPAASVSTPLAWDELSSELRVTQFTIMNLTERLDRVGDLFQSVLSDAQDLLPAIEALQALSREQLTR